MVTRLIETLNTIEKESGDFDRSFDLVDSLVLEYGETDLANQLYENIPSNVKWQVVADLFSILIWSTNDNGSEIMGTMEDWLLQANNERKARIAIYVEPYPFKEKLAMEKALLNVAKKFTNLKQRCSELIESRQSD